VRPGRCLCGQIRYETRAEPEFVCICHCESCRRATGSAMVAWATFRESMVTITQGTLQRRESSPGVTRGHCAACGTHITYQHVGRPGAMDITLSTFDGPLALEPTAHIWVADKLPWVQICDGLQQYQETVTTVPFRARIDDLKSAEVQELVAEHLQGMHSNTPAGHVHALALDNLRRPDVTFWTAWEGQALCGCGALKELDSASGEIKSMRTRANFLRRGVGQFVLDEIVRTAVSRGYLRLYLETGTGPAFEAAHALYMKNGFGWCGAFGDYTATDFNVFMRKDLQGMLGCRVM
jgi:putative acetyltransferase